MKLQNQINKGRATATKIGMAYAAYQSAKNTAQQVADQVCHVWRIEEGYADETFEAARVLALRSQTLLPTSRQKRVTGDTYKPEGQFSATEWTWCPIAGVSRLVQARMNGSSVIEFRSPRLRDLDLIQARVAEVEDELRGEDVEIQVDFKPRFSTDILTWNKGEWDYRKTRWARTFESVVLPIETQREIEDELRRYSESRDRLQRLEMPWRRGFLLSGPPGTGKTSVSLAIAGALRFNLASLSLTDVEDDGALRKAVSTLPRGTVLVIEDIDAYGVSHERDHNTTRDGGLSLSGLLNSLDGFETPEGLVTILTTNHEEKLDAALVRSGRIDRTFHLGYIEATELERLFLWFHEQQPPSSAPIHTGRAAVSPADAAEFFKQNLDDPQAGWKAVLDHIEAQTNNHNELEVVA